MFNKSLISRAAVIASFATGLLQYAQPALAADKVTDTVAIPSATQTSVAQSSQNATSNFGFAPGGGGFHPGPAPAPPPPAYHPAPPPPPVYHPAPPPPVYHPAPPPPVYHPAPPPPVYHPAPPVNHPAPPPYHPAPPVNHPNPPPVYHPAPPVTHPNPPVTHPNPPVTHPNPPVTHPNPPVTHPNPPVTHPNPPVTHPNPPVTHPNPPVTHPNPPVTHPNPPVNHPLPPHPVPPVTGPHPIPHPGNGIAKPTHPLPPGAHNGGVVPNAPVKHLNPPKVVTYPKPSHLSNPITKDHIGNANRRQADIRQRDPAAFKYVNQAGQRYRQQYRNEIAQRTNIYRGYYRNQNYRYFYSDWYRHGFYGGYYYPVRACDTIDSYFTYPMVYWMFDPSYDQNYWNDYYGDWQADDGSASPAPAELVQAFPFAGVFYPTDTLRDLGIEISALDGQLQANFRAAMGVFAQTLQQDIANQLGTDFQLAQYDVVVDHYQNLQNEAIVIEGFVDHAGSHFAFKALLDLAKPDQTQVFLPSAQDTGNGDDLSVLNALNARIQAIGGDPYTADQEPQTNVAPTLSDDSADVTPLF